MPAVFVTPKPINVTWDRSDIIPTLPTISLSNSLSGDLSLSITYSFEGTAVEWLYAVENSLESVTPYLESTIAELPNGIYKANIYFSFSDGMGGNANGVEIVNLTITGISSDAITTDKSNYNVVYVRSTNTFSGETAVEIINNTESANLEFSTIGNLLKESTVISDIVLEDDPASPFATNPELPTSGIKVVNCRLKKGAVYVHNFTVTIAVIENDEIINDPKLLDFKLRKGYNETQSKVLQIINPLNKNFTITGPDWLNFDVTSGNSTINLAVTTDNSETVALGTQSGNIEVTYDSKVTLVPVMLLVVEFISIKDGDFCLDDIILTATRQNEDARILRITMTADFHTNEAQFQNVITYDVMYQNSLVKTDIGTKVHRMFPRNRKSSFLAPKTKPFENILVYKPAKIVLKVEEMDINYVVKKTVTLPAFYLYPGKKPKMFPLFTNHNIRRRVDNSAYVFSYLADQVSPTDIVGSAVASNPVLPGEVYTVKIEDAENLITWTDKKTILAVDFYKLKQREPILVEWQNQNFVPELFPFTGEFTKGKDKTQIYQDNSFTQNNEKMEVRNSGTLKLNTGFILKAEAALIDELIDSKLCLVKIAGKTFEAFSLISKFIEEDSALELYQYEVEFLIIKEI